MKIDEKTGLVQLPEDMFWRIDEDDRKVTQYGYPRQILSGLELNLVRKTTETIPATSETKTEKVRREGFWKRLFLGTYEERTVTFHTDEKVKESTETLRRKSTFEIYGTNESADEHTVREGYRFWHRDEWSSKKYWYIKENPLTREHLSKLSETVWTDWITRQHEEAISENAARFRDSFVGDYPPKTLVGAPA